MAIIHNGVTLPELPCPYECNIVLYAASENAYVMISSSVPIVVAENVVMAFVENATISMYAWMDGQGLTDWMADGEDVPMQGGTELFPIDAGEIIYSDYDVIHFGTEEVYFKANNVKTPLLYYGGIRMAELPADVLAERPYAIATKTENEILVYFCKADCAYIDSGDALGEMLASRGVGDDGNYLVYKYNPSANDYEYVEETIGWITIKDRFGVNIQRVVWTNTDIFITDIDTQEITDEIYLKGSEALSEETQVAVKINTLCDMGDVLRGALGVDDSFNPQDMNRQAKKVENLIKGFCDRSIANINIPSGVKKIGKSAFQFCAQLKTVTLPDGLESIETLAFATSGLTEVTIPASVKTIGGTAFLCPLLKTVTFKGTPESIDASTFSSAATNLVINVPWAEGAVANAPWGATNATINYNYTG